MKLPICVLALCALGPAMVDSASADPASADPVSADPASEVVINSIRLSEAELRAIETQYSFRIPTGAYWYDSACGAWGIAGGQTAGFTVAGLSLGGPLLVDASGGSAAGVLTGIFINGREIHPFDAIGLYQIVGQVYPGRYWVDAQGNAGMEGGPALVNLFQAARASGGSAGYHHAGPGGYTGSDGDTYYFFDPETGSSVMGSN